jgi:hypothetical protein
MIRVTVRAQNQFVKPGAWGRDLCYSRLTGPARAGINVVQSRVIVSGILRPHTFLRGHEAGHGNISWAHPSFVVKSIPDLLVSSAVPRGNSVRNIGAFRT